MSNVIKSFTLSEHKETHENSLVSNVIKLSLNLMTLRHTQGYTVGRSHTIVIIVTRV